MEYKHSGKYGNMNNDFRFIYIGVNGHLEIVMPMRDDIIKQLANGLTEEQIKQRIVDKDVLPYCPSGEWHEVHRDEIDQSNRYFRMSWMHDKEGRFYIDRAKAEAFHMNNLRVIRDEKLKELDVEYMRAIEEGDKIKQDKVSNLKKKLRDMPQTEDLSKFTIDDLKDYIPDYLKE